MSRSRSVRVLDTREMNTLQRAAARIFRLARKSRTFRTVINVTLGGPSWSKQDVQEFSREGYSGNPHVYAACNAIVQGMAEPPPILYRVKGGSEIEKAVKSEYTLEQAVKGRSKKKHTLATAAQAAIRMKTSQIVRTTNAHPRVARRIATKQLVFNKELEEITAHPILDLLARPNGWYQTSFYEYVTAFGLSTLLAGEIFTEPKRGADATGAPNELYILPAHELYPDRSETNNPIPAWRIRGRSGGKFTYSPDPIETELFFNKLYNPISPLRGLSPMEAAVRSVDLNNKAREWNLKFIGNAAVPPALVTGEFDEDGAEAIRETYAEDLAGASNAGNIITLSGTDLKYHPLAMDAAKLQWGDVMKLSAKETAIVFGVAPEILGDSENKTYSNYQEARLALYQDRVLPLADFMYHAWNSTWVKRFSDDLVLDYDGDQIIAIQSDIQKVYERLRSADFLTIDEKRMAVGYEELPDEIGKVIMIPLTMIPLSVAVSGETGELAEHYRFLKHLLESAEISTNGQA